MLLQAVQEHAGDPRPLIGLAGLLLDDRGKRNHLTGGFDRQIGRPGLPDLIDDLRLGLLHARQGRLPAEAARKVVSLREDRSLARDFLHVAEEKIHVTNPLYHLLARQSFGNRQRMQDHFPRDQLRLDLADAVPGLEFVLAAFQRVASAVEQGRRIEPCRALDHSCAFELVGDAAAVILAHDVDDLVRGQRSGLADSIISHATPPTATRAPKRTKVRRPLTLAMVKPRGFLFFGSFAGGGAALNEVAGLAARRNKLARGLSFPLPGLVFPLMRPPVSRLMPPLVIRRRARAKLDAAGRARRNPRNSI